MATYEKVAASTNGERELSIDRLSKIDGIARRTAEAMYEIGVHSYADLAQYLSQRSAQQVSAALREQGVKRPPALIDPATWARQARAFGELEDAAPTPTEGKREPAAKPGEAPSSRDSREDDAVFTVSFDVAAEGDRESVLHTIVRDRANGDQEGVFTGNDAAPWVNWILERAHLPFAVQHIAALDEAVSSPFPVEPDGTQIEIGDVQLSVIGPTVDSPEKKLQAEVSFQLSGSDAETLASKGIPFRIEGYTVDIETGVSELVASEQSQLEPQVFEYVGQQEFGIPDVGRYEFHSIVLLLPPGKTATYHCGPTIWVVP
jgi:hypothetical protein